MKLLQTILMKVFMNCRDVAECESRALESPPGIFRRLRLRIHHAMCLHCRRYAKHIRWMREAMRKADDKLEYGRDQALSEDAKTRLKETLENAE